MARLLRMPEVAANAVEAVLSEWPLPENTPFSVQDAIARVETEKAVVDVPADADGVILKRLVPAGAVVQVGAPIALLGDPDELVEDLAALLVSLGVAPDPALPTAQERGARIFSSPLARRLARDSGLSIADLRGTGPGGRIVRRDVQQATDARETSHAGPAMGRQPGDTSVAAPAAAAAYHDIPHTRMRRAIAARLTQSTRDAPHFFVRGTARVDKLLRLRARLNGSGPVRVSINDLVVTAAARARPGAGDERDLDAGRGAVVHRRRHLGGCRHRPGLGRPGASRRRPDDAVGDRKRPTATWSAGPGQGGCARTSSRAAR